MMNSGTVLRYFTVDAFTSSPFSGNPAAVIVFPDSGPWLEDVILQNIAAEFNYAETAFVRKTTGNVSEEHDLRWFTPTQEVKLCGHATLAAAFVMKTHPELLHVPLHGKVIFRTLSGQLIVDTTSEDGLLMMDFPADQAAGIQPTVSRTVVAKAIGLTELEILHIETSKNCGYVVIEVSQQVDIASLSVDSEALGSLFPNNLAQGITALADDGRILCRVFASSAGIPEDPVTGSMYTVLGPYWAWKTGQREFKARQCSKRGGDVVVQVKENGRVVIGGHATLIMEGILHF